MSSVVLYLHVHQPWRIKPYSVFDIATTHHYFDGHEGDMNNRAVFEKVAEKSYRPMNTLLLDLLRQHPEFKLSLSITGTFLEQAEAWAPDVIASFKSLVDTGRVEIVAETYYHSLAFFYNKREFEAQVELHRKKIVELFGVTPTAFRNTELAYNDSLAQWADQAGYKTILAEGWEPVLGWRSPNFVYQPPETKHIKLLLKNYQLSDDLAFRFSDKAWIEYPLMPEKYVSWLESATKSAPLVDLFMDYETFGEHQWSDSGIFTFFKTFISDWLKKPGNDFCTITEAAEKYDSQDIVSSPETITWADTERDLTAWLGNAMQQEALRYLYELEPIIRHSGDASLLQDWQNLQTSDHVYYMCNKWFKDGDVHAYFSPYDSPYDAFLYFMNCVRDLRWRASTDTKIGGIHG